MTVIRLPTRSAAVGPQPDPPAVAPADAPSPPAPATWADWDRLYHAAQGQLTRGSSPLALGLATADWATHLANAPFRRAELAADAAGAWLALWRSAVCGGGVKPEADDHRFASPRWETLPYSLYGQAFLHAEALLERATTGLPGVNRENERLVRFAARQWLDAFSPSNLPWTNPEVMDRTMEQKGANLLQGAHNWLNDLGGMVNGPSPAGEHAHKVGGDLAVTPGQVVFRNSLMELIQYAPQTATVQREPILIIPAWIMKYYILDLSPHNSLIRHLVQQGHTVFCVSWRNPGPEMRDVGFDDYRKDGLMAALAAVNAICPAAKVHACGYCLGGTLLAIAAAGMARESDDRLASVTLLCAQTDFTEAGELQIFTTEDQVTFLEDVMAHQGYLEGQKMGGAFELLRSRDLVWSRMMKSYWLGEEEHRSDLMSWNADATRMPARMHSEYLRRLFLDNDLAEGRLEVDGRPVALSDIRVPAFVVSTKTDHVAPWRSVYKFHFLSPAEITFVLTAGGHNAGIVSEPGHPGRSYLIQTRTGEDHYVGPDEWAAAAERREGSWWLAWEAWLEARSTTEQDSPATLGAPDYPPLGPAPGTYVMER